MSTEIQRPWIPAELPKSSKKTSLVDDIADIFALLWEGDEDGFRELATSTDSDDAVEGTVTIDKTLLAALVKKAALQGSRVSNAKVSEISRVMYHAAKRFGVDRRAIAARKAEFLAVEASRPAGEQSTPPLNERRGEDESAQE